MIAVPKSRHQAASVPRPTTPWATSESSRERYRTQVPQITILIHLGGPDPFALFERRAPLDLGRPCHANVLGTPHDDAAHLGHGSGPGYRAY